MPEKYEVGTFKIVYEFNDKAMGDLLELLKGWDKLKTDLGHDAVYRVEIDKIGEAVMSVSKALSGLVGVAYEKEVKPFEEQEGYK